MPAGNSVESTIVPDAIVNIDRLNLRLGPGTAYEALAAFSRGTTVEIIGKTGNMNWLKVRLGNGQVGWMSRDYLVVNISLANVELAEGPRAPARIPSPSQPTDQPPSQLPRSNSEQQPEPAAPKPQPAAGPSLSGTWRGTVQTEWPEAQPAWITFHVNGSQITSIEVTAPFLDCDPSSLSHSDVPIQASTFSSSTQMPARGVLQIDGSFSSADTASGRGLYEAGNTCSSSFTWSATKQ